MVETLGLKNFFSRSSRILPVITAAAFVCLVGLVDYTTGFEISFSVFYLLPVGMTAWQCGEGLAVFIAALSVVVWSVGDLVTGAHFSSSWVPVWNALILLAFYLVVVRLLTNLRGLQLDLEARVGQRTAALTLEVAGRERLERELLEISERERYRIGHDLHDSLGQQLTGTALAGKVLEEKLAARHLVEAADAAKVVQLVEEAINLTRKLAKGLAPVDLEADGLMSALENHAAVTSAVCKVACRFECELPVLVHNSATAGHLYRIAQESVANALKHGRAKNILIRLEAAEESTVLVVRDDGCGLPERLPKNSGMGLRIMAHRAEMVGATFQIRSLESGGTQVTCELRVDPFSGEGARG